MSDSHTPKTPAERQAALRSRGRRVDCVLRNEDAIARLDALTAQHGSQRAALESLLGAASGKSQAQKKTPA